MSKNLYANWTYLIMTVDQAIMAIKKEVILIFLCYGKLLNQYSLIIRKIFSVLALVKPEAVCPN